MDGSLPVATEAWLAWVYYVADELDPSSLADPVAFLSREPPPTVPLGAGIGENAGSWRSTETPPTLPGLACVVIRPSITQ